jgi:hypothetical protein
VKVGDTLWCYDPNNRVYAAGSSAPTERGYWRPRVITGENKASWLCEGYLRVVKKTMRTAKVGGFGGYRVLASQQAVDDEVWLRENRHAIAREVEMLTNHETLKRIHAVLFPQGAA